MKKNKLFFEKFIVGFVFAGCLLVLAGVLLGIVFKVSTVEKRNPVLVSGDFMSASVDGRDFIAADEAPDNLKVIDSRWLDGVRIENRSRLDQAFRDRFIYALFEDENGTRYLWIKDGDFYQEGYVWADWSKDYKKFKDFDNSYFFKEK